AWIGSLPLIWWYFYLVSPISLFANLVVVPLAFFVLAVGLLSILAAPFSAWVSIIFNNANWCLAKLVLGSVHLFAQIPAGHYYFARPDWQSTPTATITVLDLGAGAATEIRSARHSW